jgi:hypothetical protein
MSSPACRGIADSDSVFDTSAFESRSSTDDKNEVCHYPIVKRKKKKILLLPKKKVERQQDNMPALALDDRMKLLDLRMTK